MLVPRYVGTGGRASNVQELNKPSQHPRHNSPSSPYFHHCNYQLVRAQSDRPRIMCIIGDKGNMPLQAPQITPIA